MKLSIVIICWNDLKVIKECLRSIYDTTKSIDFEVIVSDNGSKDESLAYIREHHPKVRIVENGANLGFAKGNNVGIAAATGEYILILNPDTIIHEGALDRWIPFADQHPEAGAFGCRVLNSDGSYQHPAKPFPTVRRYWLSAFCMWPLGYLSDVLTDRYVGWSGETTRSIDWQSGCCVMLRGDVLKKLGGFDERFFYHFEEVDLCRRVWDAGFPILHCPDATITHLGGQSVGRFPIRFTLEKYRNRYRYVHKHFGMRQLRQCHRALTAWLRVRQLGYGLFARVWPSEALRNRLEMYRVSILWNKQLDPVRFIECGEEPNVGYEPLAPAPKIVETQPALESRLRIEFITPVNASAVMVGIASGSFVGGQALRLRQQRALKRQCARHRTLVLTYDDGPGRDLTPALLGLLESWETKASFFLLGRRAERDPHLVDQLVQNGHEVGCHGYVHVNAWKTWPSHAITDLCEGYRALEPWIKPDGPFRPPFGKLSISVWRELRRRRAFVPWWTIDSGDTHARLPSSQSVADSVAQAGGGVVLMHDCDRESYQQPMARAAFVLRTTELLLETAKREGLTVCRYSDLWESDHQEAKAGTAHVASGLTGQTNAAR